MGKRSMHKASLTQKSLSNHTAFFWTMWQICVINWTWVKHAWVKTFPSSCKTPDFNLLSELCLTATLSKFLIVCTVYAYFSINLKCIVSIYIIDNFKLIIFISSLFLIWLSFTMFHGFVVLSLIKPVKYFLYLCDFVDFRKNVLLQIKVSKVVIYLVAGWFSSWLITF